MSKDEETHKQITKWIRRIARLGSFPMILYALLLLIGVLSSWITTGAADPYAVEDYPPVESLPPILMIPGIMGLGIAWRWEGLGGAINLFFQTAVILSLLFIRPITEDFSRAVIPYFFAVAAAAPGILFVLYWRRSSTMPTAENGA